MLQVKGLESGYGDVNVLWGVDLDVEDGDMVALVGANGVGKSTLLRTISGLVSPTRGDIHFRGASLRDKTCEEIVRAGISQIPEGRQLFPGLTVRENLRIGGYLRKDVEGIQTDMRWVFELFPILQNRMDQLAGTLSGGEQQMCAIGRGLMAKPKLLIIDELSLGLAPVVAEQLFEIIKHIHGEGLTLLVVEQDIQSILEICNKGYVMEMGKIVIGGNALDLLANEHIRESYLGL
jgi:branched-chain amino acid transport system ATP-binding protein